MVQSGRRRRLKNYLVGTGIGLAVLAALSWLALPGIVERGLKERMTSAGIPVSHLTVTAVGIGAAEIANLRIGDHDELTAARIVARFTIGDLIAGRVDSVEIRDLRISAQLDANGLTVNGLERTGTPGRIGDSGLDAVPPIAIENGRVDLMTGLGRVALPFDATITPAADGTLHAAIETRVETEMGRLAGRIDVSAIQGTINADIRIDDGTIAIGDSLQSTVAGHFLARRTGGREPTLQGVLQLGPTVIAGMPFAGGSVAIDGSKGHWTSRLSLIEGDGKSDLQTTLTLTDSAGSPHAAFELHVSATAASELWQPIGAAGPSDGRAALDLSLEGRPPTDSWAPEIMAEPGRILRLLAGGDLDGSVRIQGSDLTFPSVGDLKSVAGSFALRAAEGALSLEPGSDLRAAILPARETVESLHLPASMAQAFDGPIKIDAVLSVPMRFVDTAGGLTMSAGGDISITTTAGAEAAIKGSGSLQLSRKLELLQFAIAPGSLQIRGSALPGAAATDINCDGEIKGSPEHLDGRMRLRGTLSAVALGDSAAQEAQLDVDTTIRLDDDRLELNVPTDSTIVLRELSSPYLATKLKELALPIVGTDKPVLSARFGEDGMTEFSHAFEFGSVSAKVPLLVGGTKPTRATLRSRGATLTGTWTSDSGYLANLDLTKSAVELPDQQVSVQALRADFRQPAGHGPGSLDFSIARIQSSRRPAAFTPVGFSGTAELGDDNIVIKGRLGDPRKRIRIALDLTHSIAAAKGHLKLSTQPILFSPGGLQPVDLIPAIGERIAVAEGSTTIAGGLSWNKGRLKSDLKLLLQDVTIALPQVDIVRLNSVIAIKSLVPFATEPSQQVAIGLLDIGVPLSDALASFRIEPGPKLVVENARLSLADGRVAVDPIEFDPGAPRIDTTLHVTDVRLEKLLELAAIDGLTATGRLAGDIPLSIRDGAVAIRDAVLSSTEPGVLRYAPETTPSALLGAGESVALALQALSNFQYSELRLTLNRAAGGDTVALMHVMGRNPDFYGGYPVEFNLNVSGKLDQILDRSLSSYRVPDTIRDRLQQFSR